MPLGCAGGAGAGSTSTLGSSNQPAAFLWSLPEKEDGPDSRLPLGYPGRWVLLSRSGAAPVCSALPGVSTLQRLAPSSKWRVACRRWAVRPSTRATTARVPVPSTRRRRTLSTARRRPCRKRNIGCQAAARGGGRHPLRLHWHRHRRGHHLSHHLSQPRRHEEGLGSTRRSATSACAWKRRLRPQPLLRQRRRRRRRRRSRRSTRSYRRARRSSTPSSSARSPSTAALRPISRRTTAKARP